MKRKILKILSAIFQAIDTLLCKLHIVRPKVIVYMDGGICSQMLMYIQGRYYADAGLDVYYDIHWYTTCGKDMCGIMPRTFELTEMWPDLEFRTISKFRRKWYLLFFRAKRTNGDMLPQPSEIKHSIYLDKYWDLPIEDAECLFVKYYSSRTGGGCKFNMYSCNMTNVAGIHVRRGDLAKGDNPIYGGVSDGYFLRAIEFCNMKFAPEKYIFFSDEPDWVEQNICPHLTQPYEIMRGNKAWVDLWMLSQCSVIIASQGSFGKVAARLNPNAVLIQNRNGHVDANRDKSYIIA